MTRVRRLALGVALLAAAGALALDMSGRAPRIAGTDHVSAAIFSVALPDGGTLCQPYMTLPSDAQRIEALIGTYGAPVPAISADFVGAGGRTLAAGALARGAREGYVQVPLGRPRSSSAEGKLCLHVHARTKVVFGGEPSGGTAAALVDGQPQPGRIDVVYLRPGRESWWQLLGALDQRFGLGKAPFFGDWTLPFAALALLGVWIAAVRLLAREIT
ncbi:MAG TPA: hypothetical protein VNV37_01885 [Solirubrobacteraceae bacterium]|jgi:hypothetical protein|nr:hypothetical protein [Solirubrobacteraceae bacterium]